MINMYKLYKPTYNWGGTTLHGIWVTIGDPKSHNVGPFSIKHYKTTNSCTTQLWPLRLRLQVPCAKTKTQSNYC